MVTYGKFLGTAEFFPYGGRRSDDGNTILVLIGRIQTATDALSIQIMEKFRGSNSHCCFA